MGKYLKKFENRRKITHFTDMLDGKFRRFFEIYLALSFVPSYSGAENKIFTERVVSANKLIQLGAKNGKNPARK